MWVTNCEGFVNIYPSAEDAQRDADIWLNAEVREHEGLWAVWIVLPDWG